MRLNGNRNIATLSAAYNRSVRTFAAVNERERNIDNGTIGSSMRRSRMMKATKAIAETAKAATNSAPIGPPCATGAWMSAYVSMASAMVMRTVPAQSMGRGSLAASEAADDLVRQTIRSVTAAIGMLMKKIARHETA